MKYNKLLKLISEIPNNGSKITLEELNKRLDTDYQNLYDLTTFLKEAKKGFDSSAKRLSFNYRIVKGNPDILFMIPCINKNYTNLSSSYLDHNGDIKLK